MMKIDSLEHLQVEDSIDWSSDNDNWVYMTDNRLISMTSIPARVKNLKYNNQEMVNLGYVNEEAYTMMKKCMLSKGAVCYLDIENEEMSYARLVVNINADSLDSVSEKINVSITCEGEQGELYELHDIKFDKSKHFKKRLKYKIHKEHTTQINDKYIYNFGVHLMDINAYSFKITAMYNDVRLKCYLNCTRSS